MRVQDIMSRAVETIAPTDTAVLANELMWRKSMHHLVVMEDNQVVGIVSDRDLGVGPGKAEIPEGQRVMDVMSRTVITTEPNATIDRVSNIFRERHISCLPVMDRDQLVGIVTTTDVENFERQGGSNPPPRGWATGPASIRSIRE